MMVLWLWGIKSISLFVQADALMCTWGQQRAGSGTKYQLRRHPRLKCSSYQTKLIHIQWTGPLGRQMQAHRNDFTKQQMWLLVKGLTSKAWTISSISVLKVQKKECLQIFHTPEKRFGCPGLCQTYIYSCNGKQKVQKFKYYMTHRKQSLLLNCSKKFSSTLCFSSYPNQ